LCTVKSNALFNMVYKNGRDELTTLIKEEKKILEFYARYKQEIVEMTSLREWEAGLNDCLDILSSYLRED
ncbi:hypothetical protein, partial [Candidatus Symbiothrix dinenymphae]|uniref:hypothetical protein n=1 Tax=Candidatus Symbiothrix dinenymphae TaxID=467085 RepID=UPI000B0773C3